LKTKYSNTKKDQWKKKQDEFFDVHTTTRQTEKKMTLYFSSSQHKSNN